ncbi:MAG: hypothetical protein MJ182_07045 [Treponema sp.]|nr:hypothetical protein [Treponema sp.]
MNIVSFENKTLKMNSGILEENFGKMSFASIITEKGVLIDALAKDNNFSFEYSGWTFGDVQSFDTEDGRRVFFLGDSPFKTPAKTLSELLEEDQSFEAGLLIIKLLTDAALNNRELTFFGPGGILMEKNGDNWKILFLPQSLYTGSVAGKTDEEKGRQINLWINPTLYGNQALRFARSNIAYKILTGRLPFPDTNTVERNADILDKKYLPIELCLPSLDPKLAEKINSELELNSAKVSIPGKKERKHISQKINEGRKVNESDSQKAARLQAEYLKAVSSFPLELLENAEHKYFSDEEYAQKAGDYMAKKSARVKTKRRIRRNTNTIVTISVIAAIIAFIAGKDIKSKGQDKTSKGLTAEQTVEAFYKSVNNLDTMFVSDHAKGKAGSNYSNIVSQMYVIGKNRQAYSRDRGIQNPAAYFLSIHDETEITEGGLFGITNLQINGASKDMDVEIPVKKDKLPAITTDKGIEVYNKMNSVQKVEFYIIHSESEDLFCEKQTDIVTLTFKKDKWIITDIVSSAEPVNIKSIDFFREYFSVFNLTDKDAKATVRILKNTYPWLPTQNAFDLELERQAAEDASFRQTFGIPETK